jgi:hypothetical protein
MSATSARRERQRAERHQLIIDTARELAEASGWDAVTTRRLAERGLRTELFWSALHGVVTLTRSARLPPEAQDERLRLLVSHFADWSA